MRLKEGRWTACESGAYRARLEVRRRGQRRLKALRLRRMYDVDDRDLSRSHVGRGADAAPVCRLVQMMRVRSRERCRGYAEHSREREEHGDNPHFAGHSHLT